MSARAAVAATLGAQFLLLPAASAYSLPDASAGIAGLQQTSISQHSDLHTLYGTVRTAPSLAFQLSESGSTEAQQAQSNGQQAASLPPASSSSTVPSTAQEQRSTSAASTPEPGPSGVANPPATPSASFPAPLSAPTPPAPTPEETQKAEEEQRKSLRKTRKSRIKELEDIRAELAEKQVQLLEREKELLDKDQTVSTLREELDLERQLRALLTKEKNKAEEQAALSMGLCTGAFTLP